MKRLTIDYSNVLDFISEDELIDCGRYASFVLESLKNKTGEGNDYVGWVDYPALINYNDIIEIEKTKEKIIKESKCLIVVGIGGSYLGAKAIIDALSKYDDRGFSIKYIGNNMSSEYIDEVLKSLEEIDFSVNVISKSGETIEPSIAFELVCGLLKRKYGNRYYDRVYVTTSEKNSKLHELAIKEKYKEFYIPSDIGGRYSVLTVVGLLPISCAGFNIQNIIKGAIEARDYFLKAEFIENDALVYACIRNILYKKGMKIEFLVSFEPNLIHFGEWWKQLYAESEGKNGKGILPATSTYSTDLHSLGQYMQEGERIIFETFLNIENKDVDLVINKKDKKILTLNDISEVTLDSVIKAHTDGGVPCIVINLKSINEYNFGYLVYFYMISCAVSAYMLGVNPFNQNGVEEYKKNIKMFLKN